MTRNLQLCFVTMLVLCNTALLANKFPTDWVMKNGATDKKVNLVFIGDGYQASEMNKYASDVENTVAGMFKQEPFKSLKHKFNVIRINVPSNESGAARNPSYLIDNYFGSTFGYNGIDRLLVPTRSNRISSVVSSSFPSYDHIIVIVNDDKYGGSGGSYATLSTNGSAVNLALHELGHSYGNLADEYWYYGYNAPNMTQDANKSTNPWRKFLGKSGVGIYPHAEDPSWYRPHQSCKMRSLGYDFCLVCKDAITKETNKLAPDDNFTSLTTPINLISANITSSSFEINWAKVSDATSYDIQLWSETNSKWVDNSSSKSTYKTLSGFTAGTKEYVRVRATNATGLSEWTNHITITLATETGGAPSIPSDLKAYDVKSTSFGISWISVSGATSYDLQLKEGTNWVDKGSTTSTNKIFSGAKEGSTHQVRVRATNPKGSSDWTNAIEVVLTGGTSNGLLSTPTNLKSSNIESTSFELSWSAIARATGYEIQVKNGTTWVDKAKSTTTSIILSDFTAGSTQNVRVRATNEKKYSEWSSPLFIKLQSGGTGVALTAPTDLKAYEIASTAFSFYWSTIDGATSYDIQYWDGTNWLNDGSTSKYYYRIKNFSAGGKEYVRVRATNSDGSSKWSEYITVQLTGSRSYAPNPLHMPSTDKKTVTTELFVYPNPCLYILNITGFGESATTFNIFSISGKLVKNAIRTGTEGIDVSSLHSGQYVIMTKNNKGQIFSATFAKK